MAIEGTDIVYVGDDKGAKKFIGDDIWRRSKQVFGPGANDQYTVELYYRLELP